MEKSRLLRVLSRIGLVSLSAGAIVAPGVGALSRVTAVEDDADVDADPGVDGEPDPPRASRPVDPREAAEALGRSVALVLSRISPLSATEFATTWAGSDLPWRRLAVADSLAWRFHLVGDDVVIDHLSRDTDPEIRIAAGRAAWVRRATGGDDGVLERLAQDPDPEVRLVARLASPA